MVIRQLLMENIRSFQGKNIIPIRPITLLVGENSSGKTTILGALNAVIQKGTPIFIDFNKAPFQFGRFEDIVTKRGGRAGSEKTIGIGFSHSDFFENEENGRPSLFYSTFSNNDGKFALNGFISFFGKEAIRITVESKKSNYKVDILAEIFSLKKNEKVKKFSVFNIEETLSDFYTLIDKAAISNVNISPLMQMRDLYSILFFNRDDFKKKSSVREVFLKLDYLTFRDTRDTRLSNSAPIRSKAKSTYESFEDIYSPEGDHIPYVIERAWRTKEDERIIKSLYDFGEKSGLFKKITVHDFGTFGSKFELKIVIQKGYPRNILFVGYGIPQVLPIIVESIRIPKKSIITLQQPEVHLHPKAQAALGSFFAAVAKADNKTFVIETHSDYIIDRIRLEVAEKKLSPDDVVIVYTELKDGITQVYPIYVNEHGDISGAPSSYRKFFLDEQQKLFSR